MLIHFKIRALLPLFFACLTGMLSAQQEPQFTMYRNNLSLFNPAATGLFHKHYAAVNGRIQWIDFPVATRSISGLYDIRLQSVHSGLGVNYLYDQLGYEKNHKVKVFLAG